MLEQHIINFNNSLYYITKKKKNLIKISNNLIVEPNKLLIELIKKDYPKEIIKDKKTKKEKLKNEKIMANALTNIVNSVQYKNDIFLDEPIIKLENKCLTIINNEQNFVDIILMNEEKKEKETIINDYKKHFEELDEILDFIVSCRFAENRRHSYLYLRVNAGFGKSFFLSILDEINLAVLVNYSDFKVPSGLEESAFENKMVFAIDEFKKFNQELKNLTNNIQIEAKFKSKVTVEIFAKLFLSAEKSKSLFADGITEQIIDRVSIIDKETVKLEDRKLYQKNNFRYRRIIKYYINQYIIKKFYEYKKLGKEEASNKASEYLKNFHNKYKPKAQKIEELIKDEICNFINLNLINIKNERNVDELFDEYIKMKNNEIYLIKANEFFKKFVDNEMGEDDDFKKSAKYLDVQDILKAEKCRPIIGKNRYRALKIDKKILNKNSNDFKNEINKEIEKEDLKWEIKILKKEKKELEKEKEKLKKINNELKNEIEKVEKTKKEKENEIINIIDNKNISEKEKIDKIELEINGIPF